MSRLLSISADDEMHTRVSVNDGAGPSSGAAPATLEEEVEEVAGQLSELLDSPLAALHEAYVGGAVAWEEWAGYKTATHLGDPEEELKRVRTG